MGSDPDSVTVIDVTDGSLVFRYSASYPIVTGVDVVIPTDAQLEAAMAKPYNQVDALGTIAAIDTCCSAKVPTADSQTNSGTCTFTHYSDSACANKVVPATTNTVLVATPNNAKAAKPASAKGTACALFPGTTDQSIAIGGFFTGSTFKYATNGAAECLSEVYTNANEGLGVQCIQDAKSSGKFVRVQCGATVAPTSNAVGAGLSAAATV